jgi:hypothetical protein
MWVVIGDFNEIMFSHDRGNIRPHAYMHAFRDSLEDCEFENIGIKGDSFTWKRGLVREQLDRAVPNNS